jgi:hypothetical protein
VALASIGAAEVKPRAARPNKIVVVVMENIFSLKRQESFPFDSKSRDMSG